MHLPLCAVTGHLQPVKVPPAALLLGELRMAHPLPGPKETQVAILNPSLRARRTYGPGVLVTSGEMAGQGPEEVGKGKARRDVLCGSLLADSKALSPHLQGSQEGGKVGTQAGPQTHLRNASWLLR